MKANPAATAMTGMMGRMMKMPLLIAELLVHAARHSGDTQIVSHCGEGELHRYDYARAEWRSRRCALALSRLGCKGGDRVATLAWNGHRHFEIYFGASGSGLVCHTLNPRLFPEQLAWIVNDASDRVLCFDPDLLGLVEALAPHCPSLRHFVLLGERSQVPAHTSLSNLLSYEELLSAETGDFTWPEFDENTAASLCYTSGTTGRPKGALYSHRSTLLHTFNLISPNAMCLSERDVILPLTPMFHACAWGFPYAAPMVGAKLVLQGANAEGRALYELIEAEGVTFAAGVPTVWKGLIDHVSNGGLLFRTLRRAASGGSPCPPALIRRCAELHVDLVSAWGMTEISPLGTVARLRGKHECLLPEDRLRISSSQGRALYGVDIAIVDQEGRALPWDGRSAGDLLVRGATVIDTYFGSESQATSSPILRELDGRKWLMTGDVATIDSDGYVVITDRTKDIIKSGGEWISSLELESIAWEYPGVGEVAVIACRHSKWVERPLLVVAKAPGPEFTASQILAHFAGRVAKWQIPDDVAFVDDMPHTATGKINKVELRRLFADRSLPTDRADP